MLVVRRTFGGAGTEVGTQLQVQMAPGGTGAPHGSVKNSHVFVWVLNTFTFTLSPFFSGFRGTRGGGFFVAQLVAKASTDATAMPLPRKPRLPALASQGTSVMGMICGSVLAPFS